jgi:hypothetical protein
MYPLETRIASALLLVLFVGGIALLLVWLLRYQQKRTVAEVSRARRLLQELAMKSPSGRFSEQPRPGVDPVTGCVLSFGYAYFTNGKFQIDVSLEYDFPPSAILMRVAPLPPGRWRIARLDKRLPRSRIDMKPEDERFAQLFPDTPTSTLPLEARRALLQLSELSQLVTIADGVLSMNVFWPKGAPELSTVVNEVIKLADPLLDPAG